MSALKSWLRARVRDDATHAEIDRREEASMVRVRELRAEREKNGFGRLFDTATAYPHPHIKKD